MVPVEPVEAILGAEPEEAVLILRGAEDGAVGKAILYLEMTEIVGLRADPGQAYNKQKYRYGKGSQM